MTHKNCLSFLLVLTVTLSSSTTGNPTNFTVRELQNFSGLFYENLGPVKIYENHFTLYHYRNLTLYDQKIKQIDSVYSHSIHICDKGTEESVKIYCNNALNQIKVQIPELKKKLDSINHLIGKLKNDGTQRRKRRGAVDVVGYGLKWLFGTLDAEDGAEFRDNIQTLFHENRENKMIMQQQAQILTTAIKNYNDSLQDLQDNVKTLNDNIQKIFQAQKQLEDQAKNQDISIKALQHLTLLSQLIGYLNDEFDNVIDSILFAKQNILHPSILSPTELKMELRHIKLYPNMRFPIDNEDQTYLYFNIMDMTLFLDDNILISALKVPTPFTNRYSLYRILPLPISTGNNTHSFIIPEKPYLLLDNIHWDSFRLLDSLDSCKYLDDFHLCKLNTISTANERKPCEVLLRTMVTNEIPKDCNIKSTNATVEMFQRIDTTEFLYAVAKNIAGPVTCGDDYKKVGEIRLKGTGILTLSPGCEANIGNHRLVAYKEESSHFQHAIPEVDISLDKRILEPKNVLKQEDLSLLNWNKTLKVNWGNVKESLKDIDKTLEKSIRDSFITVRGDTKGLVYGLGLSLVALIVGVVVGLYMYFRSKISKRERTIYVKQ